MGEYAGINLYAKQFVHGRDRKQLERLAKYITRPPVSNERLSLRADGRLELAFKNVWKDGTRGIVLEPHDLITRLIAAVPPQGGSAARRAAGGLPPRAATSTPGAVLRGAVQPLAASGGDRAVASRHRARASGR
ncbi:MAG: hypothetical protein GY772_18100 [bacterium]|nr:hypothetical protein [bacterium]